MFATLKCHLWPPPHTFFPIILLLASFKHQLKLMAFHLSLSDSKSPQISWTLLSILAVLNNAVVWMVSTRSATSKFSSSFNDSLVTVPKAPITIAIIVTCMFHSFFQFPSKGTYLSFHFLSILFCGQPRQQSPQFCKFSFFVVNDYKVWSSGQIIIIIIIYSFKVLHTSISW